MHWVLVSARHHPSHGGIGAHVWSFCTAAREAGWRVDLLTRPGPTYPPAEQVHVIRTRDDRHDFGRRIAALRSIERIRPYRYGLWSLAVAERLREFEVRPDAIEFVDCQAEGYASLCSHRVRDRFPGVPMIVHAHTPMFIEESINGCDARRFGRSIYHGWERAALRAADGIITVSALLAKRLGQHTQVIAPCLPVAPSRCGRADGSRHPYILFVGSVQPRKGVDVWARSLNRVLRVRPDVSAVLIGSDTMTGPGETSMSTHVRALIAPALRSRVHWRGPLSHGETRRAIESAAVVVVPSRFESFSYVGAEALLSRRPVVLSDRVGLREWIGDPPGVPIDDAAALARAQRSILGEPSAPRRAAARFRSLLLDACTPARHLREKAVLAARFADVSLRRSSRRRCADDAIEHMRRFLRGVETREASVAAGSRGARVSASSLEGNTEEPAYC
ncbi:MAG: glycosyltransferase family 4 protein [Planctomycetota bacterium]|nr:glycosyltransferase family 4 protein [Planctomycetota bacterium]